MPDSLPPSAPPPEVVVLPEGTESHIDIAFGPDPCQRLDLYFPRGAKKPAPTLVWIHGGGWRERDKRAVRIPFVLEHGYALASIGYRLTGQGPFPIQIQDVNAGLRHLHDHAAVLGVDARGFVISGASSGGHLAALAALARAEQEFGSDPRINILGVIDFYGPSDLLAMCMRMGKGIDHDTADCPEALLLGAAVRDRPDLARRASPTYYVTPAAPPFLFVHGYDDETVPFAQSALLDGHLRLAGIYSKLLKLEDAGHGGPNFQTPLIHKEVLDFAAACFAPRVRKL